MATLVPARKDEALDYIEAALDSQDPLDAVIVLLGTNELKFEMQLSPDEIGESMEKLLRIIQERPSQFRDIQPKIILLSPPIVDETTGYCRAGDKYLGATLKSQKLADKYEEIAGKLGIGFVSLVGIPPGVDGVHIEADGHSKVAELVKDALMRQN